MNKRLWQGIVVVLVFILVDSLYANQQLPLNKNNSAQVDSINKKISLNFQRIKIRAALQFLAELTGINMIVSDKVQGEITLRLNDVPWEDALDLILKTNGLDKKRSGNIMWIAPVAELSQRQQSKLKNMATATELTPLTSQLVQINYARAATIAALLKDKNNSLMSKRGRVGSDVRTNTIWIKDTKDQLEQIKSLIKRLDVPVKQVLIEARIVNVTKDFAKDLGIRFGIANPTANSINDREQREQSKEAIPFAERLNIDLVAAPISSLPAAAAGITLAKLGDNVLLDLELSALETEGRGEIISNPRLITTNQQPAVIEAGEEIPYQEAMSNGATAVAFKKAVLSLRVTPQITPDKKIILDLQINQNTASPQLFNGVPAILTKEMQTNVLVDNGQTIVLGGIYKQDKNNIINRVPFLGNLPLVGVLFRNKSTTIKNEELLIFITPRIIPSTPARQQSWIGKG